MKTQGMKRWQGAVIIWAGVREGTLGNVTVPPGNGSKEKIPPQKWAQSTFLLVLYINEKKKKKKTTTKDSMLLNSPAN